MLHPLLSLHKNPNNQLKRCQLLFKLFLVLVLHEPSVLWFLGLAAHFECFLFKMQGGWTGSEGLVAQRVKSFLVPGDSISFAPRECGLFAHLQISRLEEYLKKTKSWAESDFQIIVIHPGVLSSSTSWFQANLSLRPATSVCHTEKRSHPFLAYLLLMGAIAVSQDPQGHWSLPT